MGFLFGKAPQPQLPPPPPQISQAMVAAQEGDQLLKKKLGAGTTMLTGDGGLSELGSTSKAGPIGSNTK